jgi:nucleoside-diphosphate kinase
MAIERTLILIKPDAVQRNVIGDIITRFERKGLTLLGMKMVHADEQLAKAHYQPHVDKPFFPDLLTFITGAPLVALVASGNDAISVVRTVVGATDGRKAAPGTIRGDFSTSVCANLVHASDSSENAEKEIGIWFPEGHGLTHWTRSDNQWLDA